MQPDATFRAALELTTAPQQQVAWPLAVMDAGDLDAFVIRWANNWLVEAQKGTLAVPPTMPELPVDGTWRRGGAATALTSQATDRRPWATRPPQ